MFPASDTPSSETSSPDHLPHRRGKAVHVHAVAAAQKRAVDIEQVRVLRIPGKPALDGSPRFVVLLSCLHADAELA